MDVWLELPNSLRYICLDLAEEEIVIAETGSDVSILR